MQLKKAPAELAVALFCHGMRIAPSCDIHQDGRPLIRRRAGLGSGLELVIPGEHKHIWVNVPVLEEFAGHSPWELIRKASRYYVAHQEFQPMPVILPPAPRWYNQKTSKGILMSRIGVLQGTVLGIYIGKPCAFWKMSPSMACQFCTTGINVGTHEESEKSVADVVETALAAKTESGVTFVHLSAGYQEGQTLTQFLPFVKAIKTQAGVMLGVECIPPEDVDSYQPLLDMGVNHFGLCYEFHDPAYFARYLPGKTRYVGQERFFNALEYLCRKMPRSGVMAEVVAGIEPVENTMAAIDYITDVGAFPAVTIFRPLRDAALENHAPPREKEMLSVFQHVAVSCMKKNIPIGWGSKVETSLFMSPDDSRYLLPRNLSWHLYHHRMAMSRLLRIGRKTLASSCRQNKYLRRLERQMESRWRTLKFRLRGIFWYYAHPGAIRPFLPHPPRGFERPPQERLLLPGNLNGRRMLLQGINLRTGAIQVRDFPCGGHGHSVLARPDIGKGWLLPENGPTIVEFTLDTLAPSGFIQVEGFNAGGHGCCSMDGKRLYLPVRRKDYGHAEDSLMVYDLDRRQVIREYPGVGVYPHDVRVTPDERLAVVASYGRGYHFAWSPSPAAPPGSKLVFRPVITVVDLTTGKALVKDYFDQFIIAHIAMDDKGSAAVVQGTAARPMSDFTQEQIVEIVHRRKAHPTWEEHRLGVLFLSGGLVRLDLRIPAVELIREHNGCRPQSLLLSRGRVYETYAVSNLIVVSDARSLKTERVIDSARLGVKDPRGVALSTDGRWLVIAGRFENVSVLDLEDGADLNARSYACFNGMNSHATVCAAVG